ncbi:hypothetical protein ACJX0J_040627, partial [Zea mays]
IFDMLELPIFSSNHLNQCLIHHRGLPIIKCFSIFLGSSLDSLAEAHPKYETQQVDGYEAIWNADMVIAWWEHFFNCLLWQINLILFLALLYNF